MRGGRADGLFDAFFVVWFGGFDDDYLTYAVQGLQAAFQLQMQALRAHDGDFHHAFLQRTAQGAADEGL